jgi:hypothetical protein
MRRIVAYQTRHNKLIMVEVWRSIGGGGWLLEKTAYCASPEEIEEALR